MLESAVDPGVQEAGQAGAEATFSAEEHAARTTAMAIDVRPADWFTENPLSA
jgi:hypothetical protein